MTDTRSRLLDYVRPSLASLWHWEENGAVLAWHDGSTIAFREEVIQALETVSPRGLPSFESVVLLLAAFHELVPRTANIIGEPPPALEEFPAAKAVLRLESRRRREQQVKEDLAELRRISQLPSDLTRSLRAKCVLIEAVFETADAHRTARDFDPEDLLCPDLTTEELNGQPKDAPEGSLLRDVHWLAKGLRSHSIESLQLRLRTGLDDLTLPLEGSLPPAELARQFLDHLLEDPEQHLIGRAALELMAAIRLPRRLRERDESAVGGVSDLSNRGPLDRLLLSELAHDDLILTTRIALNEALFLRHDPPEHEPASDLAILLDSGIRMWGLPRMFAAATALAIAANGGKTRVLRVWRAHGRAIVPVDLLCRDTLLDHLEALETDVQPGNALRSFHESIQGKPRVQSVLITHADTLKDPAFRKAVASSKGKLTYIATVSREGHFALHSAPFLAHQTVCESQLDVGRLFSSSTAASSVRDNSLDPDLPAFVQQTPCPLRLPIAGKVNYWIRCDGGRQLAVMSDRRLVEYEDPNHGGDTRIPRLPPGRTLWLERVGDAVCLLKAGSPLRPCRLISLEPGSPLQVIELGAGLSAVAAIRSGNVLLVIREHDVCAYSLTDGRLLDRSRSPSRWHRGRFFSSLQKFHFATWDGTRVRFESVPFPPSIGVSSVVTIFDREGLDGPWILNQLCQAISLATGERIQIPLPIGQSSHRRNIHVSRDGHRVYLTIPDLSWHILLDLTIGKAEIMHAPLDELTSLDPPPPLPQWNLLRSMEAVSGTSAHPLTLRNRIGTERALKLEPDRRLRFVECSPGALSPTFIPFHPFPSATQAKHGCTLESAVWPGGSRAFLDHRGLLHLKSHDTAVPEISLVLTESEVAGWASDQSHCGTDFFLRQGQTSQPERIYTLVQEFLRRL